MEYKDLDQATLSAYADYDDHYRVRYFTDAATGLKAVIALHDINLGPALGGCRFYDYGSEQEAIRDVLRLSRGMTYKNALAGLPLGGGKAVIIGDPGRDKTPAMMEAMGRAVETLGGDYISAEDSGTNMDDMAAMRRQTMHVMGLKAAEGAIGGDPSPVTAYGVFCGIRAALRHKYGSDDMHGLGVAVQGLGAVGFDLCRYLDEQGATLFVTDVRPAVIEKAQAQFREAHAVALEDIFAVDAKVFAPCALGAQINERTIPQMSFQIIAGAANNQLETPQDGDRLAEKGILYVPDYVINAAGVIAVGYEYFLQAGLRPYAYELTRANMMSHVERIGDTIETILTQAETSGITPGRAADRMAEAIFGAAGKTREKATGVR